MAAGRNLQAEMLTGQARCLQKAGGLRRGGPGVCPDRERVFRLPDTVPACPWASWPGCRPSNATSGPGISRERQSTRLDAYRELLKKPSALSEDQFKTYISLVGEAIDTLLAREKGAQISEEYRKEYADLKKLQSDRMKEWEAAGLLRKEVIPELARRLSQSGAYSPNPYRFSRNIGGKDLLLLAAWIPDRTGEGRPGCSASSSTTIICWRAFCPRPSETFQLNDGAEVVLADLAGRPLSGKRSAATALPLATEYFEDNFPPWKIELFQAPRKGPGILDLRRNFYFWTILTLIVVLAFGAFLIARTIAHEMEVLKIKSDFVSSVSHEFKTPLTSIKALMERLVEGKVRDAGKMDQYFSIIAQDTDKLTRLVNNLLDFSKIEEGKKEYVFADTDIVRIATEQVERFKKEQVQRRAGYPP